MCAGIRSNQRSCDAGAGVVVVGDVAMRVTSFKWSVEGACASTLPELLLCRFCMDRAKELHIHDLIELSAITDANFYLIFS